MAGLKHTPQTIDRLITAHGSLRILQKRQEDAMAKQQEADRQAMLTNVEHEGFCVKCRKTQTVVTAGEATHANGMKSIHGACPECNTNVHRFIPKEKPDGEA